nr:hypothetical protein [Candidatus Gracilibacteria bacterium]
MSQEFAPPPPKVRVTKKQLKEIQENYKKAGIKSKKFEIIEEAEKAGLDEEIEKKLDDVF